MKIPMDAVILHLLAALFLLTCADLQDDPNTGMASAAGADLLRRETAIKAQRTLDRIHDSIEAMRAEVTRATPENRAALEHELAGVERLYQLTRKQLLLLGAEDAATSRLIEQSFPDPPTTKTPPWGKAG